MEFTSFGKAIFWLALFFFASTALVYWPFNSWLEQQRVGELVLGAVGLAFLVGARQLHIGSVSKGLLLMAVLLGLISSLQAAYPLWALHEWSKAVGLIAIVMCCSMLFEKRAVVGALLVTIGVVTTVLAVQFLLFYLAALAEGKGNFDPMVMYPGFDNPRFYAQALILLCPLSMVSCSALPLRWQRVVGCSFIAAAIVQWAVLVALAGRGSWLAVTASMLLLLCCGRAGRSFAWRYACCILAGVLLFFFLFYLIPWALDASPALASGFRTDLSMRDFLWGQAWKMFVEHPFLGVGPLHYSAAWNHIGAHPHQMFLQLSAEWGSFVAFSMLGLSIWGLWRGRKVIMNDANDAQLDAALWAAMVAALILGQVDGVLVMPYCEGWLAILCGLAVSRWSIEKTAMSGWAWLARPLAILALCFIVWILIFEVPRLYEVQKRFWDENRIGSPPRFWDQGWIPMDVGVSLEVR